MENVRVVTAVDLSDISPAVVRSGVDVARKVGGRCLVVHVVEALSGQEEAGPLLPPLRRWVEKVRSEAQEALRGLLDRAGFADAEEVVAEVANGRAFSCVIARARAEKARFIVVGGPPPGRGLGSTAERVVRKSPIPVLVMRHPPPRGYRNVLAGVDFSQSSVRAWDSALAVAERGARVMACHVLNTWGLPKSRDVVAAEKAATERLAAWAAERSAGHDLSLRVETGTPKVVLLRIAEQQGADLLAVGSRGRARLAHVLLGSVAEAAARRATCDVLVAGEERMDFRLP